MILGPGSLSAGSHTAFLVPGTGAAGGQAADYLDKVDACSTGVYALSSSATVTNADPPALLYVRNFENSA
jgi:hypothetical protein